MALNTGIIVNQETAQGIPLANDLAIAVFGTTSTGTIAAGELTKITTENEATELLGDGGTGDTLPAAVAILQRYGCGNIIACKIEGADAAAQETDLIAQLPLLNTAIADVKEQPRVILFPSFNSEAVIGAVLPICTNTYAIAIANFAAGATVADAITARGGATGLGTKDPRLVVTHGYLTNANTPADLEGLDIHLAGAIANLPYGSAPLGYELKEVGGVDVSMTFGLSSETDDPERLNDVGVVSVNLSPGNDWLVWGSRNSSYSEDGTASTTFINAIRARDEISFLTKIRAAKLLGLGSTPGTANLLTESYRTMLGAEISAGNISGYDRVAINAAKTDYAASQIWHDLEFTVFIPLELIGVNVYLAVSN